MKSIIKYFGGKSYLARRIVAMMPHHTHYYEPFFGGGAVLFEKKHEGVSESVNDINNGLINFWRVLQDQKLFLRFKDFCDATPFSEAEFLNARAYCLENKIDPKAAANLYHAWRYFIVNRQSRQGMGKVYATPTKRIRRSMNENVASWLAAVHKLPEIHKRLRRVEIRNMDFEAFVKKYDHENAVGYFDPPYIHSTRSTLDGYKHEMSEDDHKRLLELLTTIKGKFILSGYPSHLYDSCAVKNNWECSIIKIDNKASSKKKKEIKHECLWFNF